LIVSVRINPMAEGIPISEMWRAIVEAVHPEKIVLFGSRARGEGGDNSDVDLLIIEKESFEHRSRRSEIARIRRALAGFHVAKDILLFDVEEERRWCESSNHVIAQALQEGRVLYARS